MFSYDMAALDDLFRFVRAKTLHRTVASCRHRGNPISQWHFNLELNYANFLYGLVRLLRSRPSINARIPK